MASVLYQSIEALSRDKGIDPQIVVSAVEDAIALATRKYYKTQENMRAELDRESGEIRAYVYKTVVEAPEQLEDPVNQITLDDARALAPEVETGGEIRYYKPTDVLGRIAAQMAKQVIFQKVREAERDTVYKEYAHRLGEVLNATVKRLELQDVIFDLGKAEARMPKREQSRLEQFAIGERVRVVLQRVDRAAKGPQVIVSRAVPELVQSLFQSEVPEIYDNTVVIRAIAREAGERTKIAVLSRDKDVDPVGACVGMKGSRVQAVVQELRGEKIDIVPWDDDSARFVCNALQPAEVSRVLLDDENKAMEIIVPDDQLSLAIGRRGQNVRLAAQLTGWKLDINSESRVKEMREFASRSLTAIGLPEATVELLYAHGFRSAKDFANASTEVLLQMPGITPENVERFLTAARDQIGKDEEELSRIEQEREERRLAEARKHPSELTQQERLLRVRGISERNIEQMANAGYKTVEDIHNEPDVVKFGEQTGLGVKKGKQVKAAVEHYLQEEARLKADLDAKKAAGEGAQQQTQPA